MINFHQVHKAYRVAGHAIPALQPTDLRIARGEVFGIIGHSGAGKSTLLRLINRLEEPSGGRIEIDGIDATALDADGLRRLRQRVGMIFQHFNLLSSKTVADNVGLPLKLAGELSRRQIDQRVAALLARVGLQDHAQKYPAQLSGGQKQRIAIGRAIINQPELIIADEPTGNLDPINTYEIVEILKKINELGTTIVITTHNKGIVDAIGKRVITIDRGRLVRDDSEGRYVL